QWAEQIAEPGERQAAVDAIRSVAPVGIGAALRMEDGYPIINELLPGTPAQLSGQIHPGDRIVALAQGNNAFVDAHNLSLQDVVQMVRGTPGSVIQLQLVGPDAQPRIVAVVRDQVKFKR